MSQDEEYTGFADARQRRVKVVAWVVIVALILVGGVGFVLFVARPTAGWLSRRDEAS